MINEPNFVIKDVDNYINMELITQLRPPLSDLINTNNAQSNFYFFINLLM